MQILDERGYFVFKQLAAVLAIFDFSTLGFD